VTQTTGRGPARGDLAATEAASTKQRGDAAEAQALRHLQAHGLRLVQRNFHTPGRGGGEIDLVMQAPDGTLVFVEVRQRRGMAQGGALASVTPLKQRRMVFAARHFLMRWPSLPACRFDVVALQGQGEGAVVHWVQGAFEAWGA
jgi:putative endonuclease